MKAERNQMCNAFLNTKVLSLFIKQPGFFVIFITDHWYRALQSKMADQKEGRTSRRIKVSSQEEERFIDDFIGM